MRGGPSTGREALQLVIADGRPTATQFPLADELPPDGMLARNYFSLTGTRPDSTSLRLLPQLVRWPLGPGYATVGLVDEVGPGCDTLAPGDWVVLPAQPTNYTMLRARTPDPRTRVALSAASLGDPVRALFAPVLGYAQQLARRHAGARPSDSVLLVGCGLVGVLLLQVLRTEFDAGDVLVCVEPDDLPADLLCERGATDVLTWPGFPAPSQLSRVRRTFVLSSDARYNAQLRAASIRPGACVSAVGDEAPAARQSWPCSPERLAEAIESLDRGHIVTEGLIAQHIHVEALPHAIHAVREAVRGRALVYDW